MLFEIKNCIIRDVLDITSGTSRSGSAWTKATVVLEHGDGDYTDTYPMAVFGDEKVQKVRELKGRTVDVKFDMRGREYNGRWYNDVRLQFFNPVDTAQAAPNTQDTQLQTPPDDNDDLPF